MSCPSGRRSEPTVRAVPAVLSLIVTRVSVHWRIAFPGSYFATDDQRILLALGPRDERVDGVIDVAAPRDGVPAGLAGHEVVLEEDAFLARDFLIEEALHAYHLEANLKVLEDGEEAIKFIDRLSSDENIACPELMLIDINLPKKSGFEVKPLDFLKANPIP